jgi:hypothetical protein
LTEQGYVHWKRIALRFDLLADQKVLKILYHSRAGPLGDLTLFRAQVHSVTPPRHYLSSKILELEQTASTILLPYTVEQNCPL